MVLRFEESRHVTPGELGPDVIALSPIQATGTVTNTGKCFLVQGDISANVQLACSRCLSPIATTVHLPFAEEFHRVTSFGGDAGEQPTTGEAEWRDQWAEENQFVGDEIDLWNLVRESVMVALPFKVLCDEHCSGICPTCGVKKSEGNCTCTEDDRDARWSELLKLNLLSGPATQGDPQRIHRPQRGSSRRRR